ncbi:ATP-binding protein [Synechocystis sp. PCC 7509]|uniref:ATP-binding protein n=1 Tax=Synechocystis sp. PCC 7509 TaxID=927677 RepID=UPI0002AC9A31|nr:ATP-binding protein [Synechocystis sp. PCC 7509]
MTNQNTSIVTSIDNLILQSTNPFDNYRSVNFWRSQQQAEPVVESIHTETISTVTDTLAQVAGDRTTRTLLLEGDPGSGKTYLLGRLKKTLNDKAFFAYISPFPQSNRIWWHILRYTVDSLVQIPAGQKDSQLMLWLKSLSVFTKRTLKERLMQDNFWEGLTSDRQKFIKYLKKNYHNAAIYNPDSFFGVLHDLINPKKYDLACEWLRGDDLSEESLKELGVKSSINTEEAACETLANFGRIATETQPIVLCFDQLESIARLANGFPDLQTLFSAATKIHDDYQNFLVIISITTDTWRQNETYVDQSHKDRIDIKTRLKPITLTDAKSILLTRLHFLHSQANPLPASNIYPINQQYLLEQFPRGKTNPREVLIFGREVIQAYKEWLVAGGIGTFKPVVQDKGDRSKLVASFKLKWIDELTKAQKQVTKLNQQSSPELIQMLQEALSVLEMEDIKSPFLKATKFANYSLSYKLPGKYETLGIVWTEDQNMTTFFHVMEACKKAIDRKSCQILYLIRDSKLGNSNNKGYKVYTQIFNGFHHRQIQPKIASVHSLVAYYELVKDAREGDLIIGNEAINLKKLKEITLESKVLEECYLLEQLQGRNIKTSPPLTPVKELLLNTVATQSFLGRQTLIKNATDYFPNVEETQINQLIEELCQEGRVQIVDPHAKPKSQLICLVVASK